MARRGIYWLASYPKSGNTWFRAWLRNLLSGSEMPADINALDTPIASSRNWLDTVLGFDTGDLDFDEVDRLRPAVYGWRPGDLGVDYHKVHDAYVQLHDGTPMFGGASTRGVVYILRNPLDVALSYAAHNGRTIDCTIAYMGDPTHGHNAHRDRLATQVRQIYLDWSGHVRSWVDAADIAVHVIRYEDMHANPQGVFTDAAHFLQVVADPARIAEAVRHSSFTNLRAQEAAKGFAERPPAMIRFFREGGTGNWRQHLNDAQVTRIIADHGKVMRRFGYLDARGNPIEVDQ